MPESSPPTPSLKTVLVEDDAQIRHFVRGVLEQHGHSIVGEATTGAEMMRQVRELDPDLVVFDIHLPTIDGLEALRQIYEDRMIAALHCNVGASRAGLQIDAPISADRVAIRVIEYDMAEGRRRVECEL